MSTDTNTLSPTEFIRSLGLYYTDPWDNDFATLRCPFPGGPVKHEAIVTQDDDGQLHFECKHHKVEDLASLSALRASRAKPPAGVSSQQVAPAAAGQAEQAEQAAAGRRPGRPSRAERGLPPVRFVPEALKHCVRLSPRPIPNTSPSRWVYPVQLLDTSGNVIASTTVTDPETGLEIVTKIADVLAQDPTICWGTDQMPYHYADNKWVSIKPLVETWCIELGNALGLPAGKGPTENRSVWQLLYQQSSAQHLAERSAYSAFGSCPGIPFKDGVLTFKGGSIERVDHDPGFANLVCLPITIDEALEPMREDSEFSHFLTDALTPDRVNALEQWTGAHLVSHLPGPDGLHRVALFKGPGGTGKSTMMSLIAGLAGKQHSVTLNFQEMSDKRMVENLKGKLAIVSDENERVKVDLGRLKTVIAKGTVHCEPKFRDPYEFKVTGLVTACSNTVPEFLEKSDVMEQRLMVILFDKTVYRNQDREVLSFADKILADPIEYKELVKFAVRGALRMMLKQAGKIVLPDEVDVDSKKVARFGSQLDGLVSILHVAPNSMISAVEMMHAYKRWCSDEGKQPFSRENLISQLVGYLAKTHPGVAVGEKRVKPGGYYASNQITGDPLPTRPQVFYGFRLETGTLYNDKIGVDSDEHGNMTEQRVIDFKSKMSN